MPIALAFFAALFLLAFSGPLAAATFTVSNTNDSGAGSLRQAILDANAASGDDTISFASGLDGSTITLSSDLPALNSAEEVQWTTSGFTSTVTISGGNLTNDNNRLQLLGKFVFNGVISGNNALSVGSGGFVGGDQQGPVTLNGSNTYTGDTHISTATLAIGSAASLGAGSTINAAQATLQANADMTIAQDFNVISVATLAAFTFHSDSEVTISGDISTSFSPTTTTFTKTGTGTLTLTGTNTYGGTTRVTGGTLQFSSESALGSSNIFLSGGTLAILADLTSSKAIELGASGGTINTGIFDTTFSGIISGSGALTKTASGDLNLSGANTYSGGTTISAGRIVYQNASAFGTGSINIDGATIAAGGTFSIANNITLNSGGGTLHAPGGGPHTFSGVISGSGALTADGAATIVLTGTNTYSGGTIINRGHISISDDANLGTGNITFDGTISPGELITSADITTSKNIALDGDGLITSGGNDNVFNGIISGTGTLSFDNSSSGGSATLNGNNTLSGQIILNGGSFTAGNSNAFGTATLRFQTTASTLSTSANLTINNDILLETNTSFNANTSDIVFSGAIGSTGMLTKNGAGVLTLSGNNNYSGGTTINGGTVVIGHNNALGTGAVTVASSVEIQNTGERTVANNVVVNTGQTVTFDTATDDLTLSGAISGAGDLVKEGNGMLILNGINTYTGTTAVNDGTLQIGDESTPSANLASNVTVANGATLSGHGSLLGNLVNSGTVSPGGSIGTLQVTGNYTQNSNGTLAIHVAPTGASQLSVTGAAVIDGNVVIDFDTGVFAPASYIIVTATGGITGTYTVLASAIPASTTAELEAIVEATDTAILLTLQDPNAAPTNTGGIAAAGSNGITSGHNAARTIFRQLGGLGSQSSSANPSLSTALAQTGVLQENTRGLAGLVEAMPEVMKGMDGWFKAHGNLASVNNDGVLPGYNSESAGFMFGLDRTIAKDLVFGAAGGYEHTNYSVHSAAAAGGQANTIRFALYGRKMFADDIALDAQAGYGRHMIETERFVAATGTTAGGEHDAHEFSLAAQVSKTMQAGGFTLTPQAGLGLVHLKEEGYTETGAAGSNLTVDNKDTNSLRLSVGLEAALPLMPRAGFHFTPEARINYSYETLDDGRNVQVSQLGTASTVQGIRPSRHILSLGTGFTTRIADELDAFGSYDINLRTGNSFEQTFAAGLKMKF